MEESKAVCLATPVTTQMPEYSKEGGGREGGKRKQTAAMGGLCDNDTKVDGDSGTVQTENGISPENNSFNRTPKL